MQMRLIVPLLILLGCVLPSRAEASMASAPPVAARLPGLSGAETWSASLTITLTGKEIG